MSTDTLSTIGVSGTAALALAALYRFVMYMNHRHVRSNCCGRTASVGIDLDTPIDENVERERKWGEEEKKERDEARRENLELERELIRLGGSKRNSLQPSPQLVAPVASVASVAPVAPVAPVALQPPQTFAVITSLPPNQPSQPIRAENAQRHAPPRLQ